MCSKQAQKHLCPVLYYRLRTLFRAHCMPAYLCQLWCRYTHAVR